MDKSQINKDRLPRHIAIIMDGNGRWAKRQGLARMFGHKQGVETVHNITEAAAEIGIDYLTLYTFSTENWNRPKEEVDALMSLLVDTIVKETPTLMKNNVRLLTIGDTDRLPEAARRKFEGCIEETAGNTGLKLVIALSYSARWEIVNAARRMAADAVAGKLRAEDISEQTVSEYMTTRDMPDPDLLIRTSGELRISNFLLWQLAYSELYFTDCLWPEFTVDEFYKAIIDYQSRERRFGKTSEQVK
ncbi:MAG: isoprenyl transferase [Paludibacteraceae bacterium]|nr:isoprenyl transferase [Paludibacteraceae bacterium]MBP5642306.1 isoprenyl transferase [Paludibacteraceae bacterium]MBQ4391208.1 isoprenyl transferase [Paludibacteraceae bacterium]MBQ4391386.1 isoprenyl transferase [Paludibacteraceae bacterium]